MKTIATESKSTETGTTPTAKYDTHMESEP